MMTLEVDQLLKENITSYPDGSRFDITDSGSTLFLYLSKPTSEEIQAIKRGKFQIAYYVDDDVIFILLKFENMNWIDAPYNIHLSKQLTKINKIEDGQGLSLTILLVDASSGILKSMRLIGLPSEFSKNLKNDIDNQSLVDFDIQKYDLKVISICKEYTTDELIKYAKFKVSI